MDATTQQQQQRGDGREAGDRYDVLLYYKYAEVPDAAALAAFYEAHCRDLALVGHVRVVPDGVNATVSSLSYRKFTVVSFREKISFVYAGKARECILGDLAFCFL
jgi:hypothetical protein